VKVVKLHIDILNMTAGGKPVISKSAVKQYVAWANQIYAQIGILFEIQGPIHIVNPPNGVNLNNGLEAIAGGLSNEEKALLSLAGAFRGVPALRDGDDDINVYYVNYMVRPNGKRSPFGTSFPAAVYNGPDDKYADSIICTDESADPSEVGGQTLAHEIGHILLNSVEDDHVDGQVGINQVNLMASPGWQVNGSVTDSRRITAQQAKAMLNNTKNLLRNP